jgi:MFS transporter, DHA1 family, multidrug resistance protein
MSADPDDPRVEHSGASGSSGSSVRLPVDEEHGRPDWRRVVVVFWVTSIVEGLGVSQVFAYLAPYLRAVGVADADRATFVGLFSALIFVVGMPLVPLWGVWADLYSRKAVIARSALVEAVVFACLALSREPWQLAASLLLIGFQLGNTGVMLAAIRDVVPRRRIGTLIAVFGVAGPVGFAVGPALGAILVDGLGWSLSGMFWVSAALSVGTAVLVWFGAADVRPEVVPTGRVLSLAYGALRGVVGDPVVRRIFAIYGVAFLASQMSRPYLALIVEHLVGTGPGLTSSIGFVAGPAALAGAAISPLGGVIGDRIGFRPVLLTALVVGGIALLAVPLVPTVPALALAVLAFTAANGLVGAMVFSLLATEVPAERRSQTLNLVYLPLYGAGIIGPAVGGALAGPLGAGAPFWAGAAVFLVGAVVVALRVRPRRTAAAAEA